jgi:hypothetical protein
MRRKKGTPKRPVARIQPLGLLNLKIIGDLEGTRN